MGLCRYSNLHLPPGLAIPTIPKVASSSIYSALSEYPKCSVKDFTVDLLRGREIVNLVRDPCDRLASLYAFRHEQWWNEYSFSDFVEMVCTTPDHESDRHFHSQVGLLTAPNGVRLIGTVFRYESITSFWSYVQQHIGPVPLDRRNTAPAKKPEYTGQLRSHVEARYAYDYALLEQAI